MFENLSKRLTDSLDKLRRKGRLSEADVENALREVRMALLEADVALPVARDFITGLKTKLVGEEIIASVNPAQMVIKLVYDALVEMLSGAPPKEDPAALLAPQPELNLATTPPAVILMCGLQGSGKTTTTGKLALRLKTKMNKRPLVASLDVYRPAAQEQLASVATTAGVDSLPIVPGEMPEAITKRALDAARIRWRIAYTSPGISGLQNAVVNGLGVSALTRHTLLPGMRVLGPEEGLPTLEDIQVGLFYKHPRLTSAGLGLINHVISQLDAAGTSGDPTRATGELRGL